MQDTAKTANLSDHLPLTTAEQRALDIQWANLPLSERQAIHDATARLRVSDQDRAQYVMTMGAMC